MEKRKIKEELQMIKKFLNDGKGHELLDLVKNELIKDIEKDLQEISTYQLQKNGVSPTTLTYFKDKTQKMNIETLNRLHYQIIDIKQKIELRV